MYVTNLMGQALMRILRPRAARRLPVPRLIEKLHRLAISLADRNPAKGKVPAFHRPGHHYDADIAQALIDDGTIMPTTMPVPASRYAFLQWGVEFQHGSLSQGAGSNADLIWVATMPAERVAKPVLFFQEPGDPGPKILDGSHRLIRAVVDGRNTVQVLRIDTADAHLFLQPG